MASKAKFPFPGDEAFFSVPLSFQCGDWIVTDFGIHNPERGYVIGKQSLLEMRGGILQLATAHSDEGLGQS
jgi:hypothetical protein